jgi:AcrR family transcriptional regulator
MADPRIQRTRAHVLAVARTMLSDSDSVAMTFTSLAAEAQVSRRTLYTHWGSIDKLIAEAVTFVFIEDDTVLDSLSPRERLTVLLRMARDRMSDPLTAVAFSMLIARAAHEPDAVEALKVIASRGRAEFADNVTEVSATQYELIVGPLFHAAHVARSPFTDDDVDELVEYAVGVLGLVTSS